MKHLIFSIILILSTQPIYSQTWINQASSMKTKIKFGQTTLPSTAGKVNEKMKLSAFDIEDSFFSIFMCDFLSNIISSSANAGISSFSAYLVTKFPVGNNGTMAYIVDSRLTDILVANSTISRHYLISVSSEGNINLTLISQGGTFIFKNGEFGSCALDPNANALMIEWSGSYFITKEKNIIARKKFISKDVIVDKEDNVTKVLKVHEDSNEEPQMSIKIWIDENGEIHEEEFK